MGVGVRSRFGIGVAVLLLVQGVTAYGVCLLLLMLRHTECAYYF